MALPQHSLASGERRVSISVITATFNAAKQLPGLIASLLEQSDADFTWVVADGGSSDETLALISDAAEKLNVVVDSRSDCGIYDALNRAIGLCATDYYLVAGGDDVLAPEAIKSYRTAAMEGRADFVTAHIVVDGVVRASRRPWEWLYGAWAHVSSHAVGLLVRTSLHSEFGRYRTDLRVASDQDFILKCVRGGVSLDRQSFVAGEFATDGTTGRNLLTNLLESFSIRIRHGDSLSLQVPLLLARLIRHRKRLRVQHGPRPKHP